MARSKSQSPLSPRTDSPLSKSFPNNILFSSLATENKQKNNETNKQNNPAMVFTFPHQGVGAAGSGGAGSLRINSSSSYNNTHVSSLGSSMTSPLVGRGKYFIEFFFTNTEIETCTRSKRKLRNCEQSSNLWFAAGTIKFGYNRVIRADICTYVTEKTQRFKFWLATWSCCQLFLFIFSVCS